MKRILICLAGCLGALFAAADVFAPRAGLVTNAAAVQATGLVVDDGGLIVKNGSGTWQLPLSYLAQTWNANFAVQEGTLEFQMGTAAGNYAPTPAIPAFAQAKALLWVDAADPIASHIDHTDGAVSTWYDRREGTDVSTPAYCRARAYTGFTSDLPEYVTMVDGQKAVWFGGYGTGKTVEWVMPNGSRFANRTYSTCANVKHVFAVHCISNSYGYIFGRMVDTPENPSLFRVNSGSLGYPYWYTETSWPAMDNGYTYLDGKEIDGTLTNVKTGLHLLEAQPFYNVSCDNSAFFSNGTKATSGGDYLCEALIFTNELDAVERVQITQYLMDKWGLGDATVRKDVTVAAGATAEVSSDANVAAGEFEFKGRGTVKKSGNGVATFSNRKNGYFEGDLDLAGGSVVLQAPMAIKAAAGDRVTVTNEIAGPTYVRTSGEAADTLVKAGNDEAIFLGLPAGVKKLKVEEGTAVLRAPFAVAASGPSYEVPIPNAGFEEFKSNVNTANGNGIYSLSGSVAKGWRQRNGHCRAMYFSAWTGNGIGMDGVSRNTWNIYTRPPEGDMAMILRSTPNVGMGTLESSDIPLEAGDYELTFMACGRQGDGYLGQRCVAQLMTSDGNLYRVLATNEFLHVADYRFMRVPIRDIPAGTYRLSFCNVDNSGLTILDDIHLKRVPRDPMADFIWPIPGGDFEAPGNVYGSGAFEFTGSIALPGWTFDQGSDWSSANAARVGVVTPAMRNKDAVGFGRGFYYRETDYPAGGGYQLAFVNKAASATTTFTPPAGTYVLRTDCARLGSYGIRPKLAATVTIGGTTYPLGELGPEAKRMKVYCWPTNFVADGSQPVTLKLQLTFNTDNLGSNATGIILDNLCLATAIDTELYVDGTCESSKSSRRLIVEATALGSGKGTVRFRNPAIEAPAAFGTTVVDGSCLMTIENNSIVYEDVFLPIPGTYRFSYYAHSRLSAKSGNYGPNPLRAWVAAGGVTNVIGYADVYNSDWVQRVHEFTVSAPGVYRVALQGTVVPSVATHVYEAHVDAISLRQVIGAGNRTSPLSVGTELSIAAGAKVKLDFEGVSRIHHLRLNGRSVSGLVGAANYPEYFVGPGALDVMTSGMTFSFR